MIGTVSWPAVWKHRPVQAACSQVLLLLQAYGSTVAHPLLEAAVPKRSHNNLTASTPVVQACGVCCVMADFEGCHRGTVKHYFHGSRHLTKLASYQVGTLSAGH